MLLHELLRAIESGIDLSNIPNVVVTGIQEDSRKVGAGNLFIARGGTKADGRAFLDQAKERGAVAAVIVKGSAGGPLPVVGVADPAPAGAKLAQAFYGEPSKTLKVLGVTGTNGKTTTAYLIRHLLKKRGIGCGLVGTVQNDDGRKVVESTLTTPGTVELAELMGKMVSNGCGACAMETSSHALHQGRVSGIRFAGGAFTNLTGDHLDYHGNMEAYAAAKEILFRSLDESGVAVVNGGDKWSAAMVKNCRGRVVRFGFTEAMDYRASLVAVTSQGTHFILKTPDGETEVKMELIGRHNIENALTAAALVGEVFGLTARQIAEGLVDAQGAPGRLQVVKGGRGFAVLVDYAHTDDALRNVLMALRPLTRGALRVMFGCGGDRDRTKRPRMAKIAEELADVVYVTSDNPRTEVAGTIIEQIVAGFSGAGRERAIVEPDRRAAIERVLSDAQAGDVVLLAGKGHENYQIIGTTKHHFDDVEEAARVLAARQDAARLPGQGVEV